MKVNIFFLCLGMFLLFQRRARTASLNECPNEDKEEEMVGIEVVDVPAEPTTSLVRRVRFPEIGLYENHLTCILATDADPEESGGEVEITEGGLGHKYVEIRLQSQIGKPLYYLLVAYTDLSSGLNETQI